MTVASTNGAPILEVDQISKYFGSVVALKDISAQVSGGEVVCILERDKDESARKYDYKLLATTKTSTLEKELREVGAAGYEIMGMTVSKTAMGGKDRGLLGSVIVSPMLIPSTPASATISPTPALSAGARFRPSKT